MIGRIEAAFRKGRRLFSRSGWAARFLGGAPAPHGGDVREGLVLIQIDGLSHPALRRAMDEGRMPFLCRLKRREGYRLRVAYAGVPSCTPAAQAELFYGEKSAVPAFEYYDREAGRLARMYDPESVLRVERRLEEKGSALLTGGGVHGDIFMGGAAEGRFCLASWGRRGWFGRSSAAPLFLLVTHLFLPFRLAGLAVMELLLALYDFARGVTGGHRFLQELKFVGSRVAVSILLREFSVMGAKVDIARGLPSVHINFFGYDEQAHRRGPSSLFARRSLKGIDDSIRRVWQAARLSSKRAYDVWIYSDHGQTECAPFSRETGRTLEEAVAEALNGSAPGLAGLRGRVATAYACNARMLRRRTLTEEEGGGGPLIAAMGPLGHLYLPSCPQKDPGVVAQALVKAGIPLVMGRSESGRARAWTAEGSWLFPDEAAAVLGEGHPFLRATAGDMAALCHHPDAGELVLYGWRRNRKPLSLSEENGAHGGPSPHEVSAFLLLPGDAPFQHPRSGPPRLWHLRQAALRFLGRPSEDGAGSRAYPGPRRRRRRLRVMTYNVHGCAGMDGRVSTERIARVIARHSPDVVALQELDAGRPRSRGQDQAALIARALGMSHVYHPIVKMEEEKYGDAILSRLPLRLVRSGSLPGWGTREPRGALWVSVEFLGKEIQVLNTHLGLLARERRLQVDALLGPEWLEKIEDPRVVLCGDFNAGPRSPVCRRIGARLRDAQLEISGRPPSGTWFGRWPVGRIDHIFVGEGLEVLDVNVPGTELDKTASDHLPVVADLGLR